MRFQINAEEFEESEETKTGAMRYKVMEAVQRTNYLENVYEQKADCIRMRKRNLGWAIGLSLGVAILLALIAATMWILPEAVDMEQFLLCGRFCYSVL